MSVHKPLRILVFCKEPRPGAVKTRLAASIGPERAASLAWAMLSDTLRTAQAIAAARPDGRVRVVHEANDRPGFEGWLAREAPEAERIPQAEGDLGDRLAAALNALERADRIALGMDAPDLPPQRLIEACAGLVDREVVLDRAPDGGYALLGLAAGVDAGFLRRSIRWSTSDTRADTIAAARAAGLRVRELPGHPDVDDLDDLRALARRLGERPGAAPKSAAWVAETRSTWPPE